MRIHRRSTEAARAAAIAIASLALLSGCGKAEGSSAQPPSAAPPAVAAAPTAQPDAHVAIPGADVEIAAPGDWPRKTKPGGWSMLVSPDKKAAFAFNTFAKGEDPTAKIGQIAMAIDASAISWEAPKKTSLGPDGLPATLARGTCQYSAGSGRIGYALVDSGGKQLLAVYVASDSAPAAVRKDAAEAFNSLRKKR